jgi:drug/metabolite transporter (DMT)-like permease
MWEAWESKIGNDRPVLRVAVGIMLSFMGGMAVELGSVHFRSDASTYRWIGEVLSGLASLGLSIYYVMRRKPSRSVIEWLNERNKPSLIFDKRDD